MEGTSRLALRKLNGRVHDTALINSMPNILQMEVSVRLEITANRLRNRRQGCYLNETKWILLTGEQIRIIVCVILNFVL